MFFSTNCCTIMCVDQLRLLSCGKYGRNLHYAIVIIWRAPLLISEQRSKIYSNANGYPDVRVANIHARSWRRFVAAADHDWPRLTTHLPRRENDHVQRRRGGRQRCRWGWRWDRRPIRGTADRGWPLGARTGAANRHWSLLSRPQRHHTIRHQAGAVEYRLQQNQYQPFQINNDQIIIIIFFIERKMDYGIKITMKKQIKLTNMQNVSVSIDCIKEPHFIQKWILLSTRLTIVQTQTDHWPQKLRRRWRKRWRRGGDRWWSQRAPLPARN